jgi:hypothetical protein
MASLQSRVGPVVIIGGLGLSLLALFGLPTQKRDFLRGGDVGFGQLHQLASYLDDRGLNNLSVMSALARFWFDYGLPLAAVLLIVLSCAVVAVPSTRVAAVAVGILALAVGVLHALALAQTSDYEATTRNLRPVGSLYDNSGLGTWLGFAGLVAIMIGAVLSALLSGRRPPPPPLPGDPYQRSQPVTDQAPSGKSLA